MVTRWSGRTPEAWSVASAMLAWTVNAGAQDGEGGSLARKAGTLARRAGSLARKAGSTIVEGGSLARGVGRTTVKRGSLAREGVSMIEPSEAHSLSSAFDLRCDFWIHCAKARSVRRSHWRGWKL